jgi:hypothetical protein
MAFGSASDQLCFDCTEDRQAPSRPELPVITLTADGAQLFAEAQLLLDQGAAPSFALALRLAAQQLLAQQLGECTHAGSEACNAAGEHQS